MEWIFFVGVGALALVMGTTALVRPDSWWALERRMYQYQGVDAQRRENWRQLRAVLGSVMIIIGVGLITFAILVE